MFKLCLPKLFDISVKKEVHTDLITEADRDFLLCHWDKTILCVKDTIFAKSVEKKLARQDKYTQFESATNLDQVDTADRDSDGSTSSSSSIRSGDYYVPKEKCRLVISNLT